MTYIARIAPMIGVMEFENLTAGQIERAKELSLMRLVSSLWYARHGGVLEAIEVLKGRWPNDLYGTMIAAHATKAVVTAGGVLPTVPPALGAAFIQYAHPFSILGRIATRRAPFNMPIARTSTVSSFSWSGEGRGKAVSRFQFTDDDTLTPLKAAGIIVLTQELLKLSAPGTELFLRDELRNGYVAFIDDRFINPSYAAVSGVSPASITNGASSSASGGSSLEDALEDVRRLHALYVGLGGRVETAVIAMSSANSVALSLTGHQSFQRLTITGGSLAGVPVVASDGVGQQLVMFDAARVLLADAGEIDFAISSQASIQMDDSSTQDGSAGTGSATVSLWQNDLAAVRIERWLNWRSDGIVARISNALYYAAGSPAL